MDIKSDYKQVVVETVDRDGTPDYKDTDDDCDGIPDSLPDDPPPT